MANIYTADCDDCAYIDVSVMKDRIIQSAEKHIDDTSHSVDINTFYPDETERVK